MSFWESISKTYGNVFSHPCYFNDKLKMDSQIPRSLNLLIKCNKGRGSYSSTQTLHIPHVLSLHRLSLLTYTLLHLHNVDFLKICNLSFGVQTVTAQEAL